MRFKIVLATLATLSLPLESAMADSFWRNVLTSGATTGSSYLTSKDNKQIVATQNDASSFVASGGTIRGAHLESAIAEARAKNPELKASDMELTTAILYQSLPNHR